MKKCFHSALSYIIALAVLFLSVGCPLEQELNKSNMDTIYISKMPDKTEYEAGEALNLSGIEVRTRYSDGTENIVTDWTSYPAGGSVLSETGSNTVTITYQKMKTTFTVKVNGKSNEPEEPELPGEKTTPFFWGTWVRMDNGKEYEVLETSVAQGKTRYRVTAADETSLTVDKLGTFKKESDSVIVCDNIPYFRNGGANLEYSLKLVGFTNGSIQSRAVGTGIQGIKGRAVSSKYKDFESHAESDTEGKIEFTAPTAKDPQTVTIDYGDETIIVPGITVSNSGDYMGTIALVGKNDYNLKITGTISDDQKDHGYLFGNNARTYNMVLTITNISENKCSTSACFIESADANLSIAATDSTNLSGFTISTLAGGATKTVNLSIVYAEITDPYVDTGISVTIKNPFTNQEWKDYIPLRFFKGTIPITIAAKNPENNNNAALNGFVIYPDGNNQFFAIANNSSKAVFVPTFGNEKPYMLVFSGATVTSQLSDSTEMYYTVEPASKDIRQVITSGNEILSYIPFGGDNHSETTAYPVTKGFEAYLREGEIDYYTIVADSDDFYGPDGSVFYSVSYVNGKGDVPEAFFTTEGAVLSIMQLPEMKCDGYEFLGWYSGDTKAVAGAFTVHDNITLTAKWQLANYSVTYNLNGGTNDAANPASYTMESPAVTLRAPKRAGYDFGGWYATENFKGDAVTTVGGGTMSGITLWAKWIPITYKITYELDGGTNDTKNPVEYTAEMNTITFANPQKEGFAFGGWFTDSSFIGTKQTAIEKGSYGDRTYYAKWLRLCTVTFVTAYRKTPAAIKIGEGEPITAEQLPELESGDYFFGGWYDGVTKVVAETYTVTDDVTFTAKWLNKYTVSYVTDHGTAPESVFVADGSSVPSKLLPSLTETGWSFKGWYTDRSCSENKKAGEGLVVTTNLTLYAKWEEYPETYDLNAYLSRLPANSADSPYSVRVLNPDISSIKEALDNNDDKYVSIELSDMGKNASIPDHAFDGCWNLTGIIIPDGVTSIGDRAFYNCSLTDVYIPKTVSVIADEAFVGYYIKTIREINVDEHNKNYCSVDGVLFSKDMTKLIQYPSGKQGNSYSVPYGVLSIGQSACTSCGFNKIIIPDTVVTIDGMAFSCCENLKDITLPNSVKTIGYCAFDCCSNLTSINIPSSVESIGSEFFRYSGNITSITVDARNKNYCSIDGVLFNKDKTELLRYPVGKSEETYTVPDGVKSIGDMAFESYVKTSCLKNIIIPDSLTSIGSLAFYGSNITSITIPNGVTAIPYGAFECCYDFTSITLPFSVTAIGGSAFFYCYNLKTINFMGTEAQWNAVNKEEGWNSECPTDMKIVFNYRKN